MAKAIASTGEAAAKPVEKRKVSESKYSSAEFAENFELFGAGVTPDIVTAAFFIAGKHEATKSEAKAIVKSFLEGSKK